MLAAHSAPDGEPNKQFNPINPVASVRFVTSLLNAQCPYNGYTDTFRGRLRLSVADVRIVQRHARTLVAEQAGDDRQWDTL